MRFIWFSSGLQSAERVSFDSVRDFRAQSAYHLIQCGCVCVFVCTVYCSNACKYCKYITVMNIRLYLFGVCACASVCVCVCVCASQCLCACARQCLCARVCDCVSTIRAPKSRSESNYLRSEHATRYHAKACNRHAGPLDDACECHALLWQAKRFRITL